MRRLAVRIVTGLLLAAATTLLGEVAWMRAKAALAGVLVDRALAAHLVDGAVHRPWSWADHHPVARLEVPRLRVRRAVLAGSSGSTLAFGLGHVAGTSRPGERGHCAVAGHRDSWAAFLRDVRGGDLVRVTTASGTTAWRVRARRVVSARDVDTLVPTTEDRLTLVTCWPFGGLTRSPWRVLVVCEPASGDRLSV